MWLDGRFVSSLGQGFVCCRRAAWLHAVCMNGGMCNEISYQFFISIELQRHTGYVYSLLSLSFSLSPHSSFLFTSQKKLMPSQTIICIWSIRRGLLMILNESHRLASISMWFFDNRPPLWSFKCSWTSMCSPKRWHIAVFRKYNHRWSLYDCSIRHGVDAAGMGHKPLDNLASCPSTQSFSIKLCVFFLK